MLRKPISHFLSIYYALGIAVQVRGKYATSNQRYTEFIGRKRLKQNQWQFAYPTAEVVSKYSPAPSREELILSRMGRKLGISGKTTQGKSNVSAGVLKDA